MFGITYRTVRAAWLGFTMLSSVTCFAFTLATHQFFGKASDVCTLTVIPGVIFIASTVAWVILYGTR